MLKKSIYASLTIFSIIFYFVNSDLINFMFIGDREINIANNEQVEIKFPDRKDIGCTYQILIDEKINSLARDKIGNLLRKHLCILDLDNNLALSIDTTQLAYQSNNSIASFVVPNCKSNKTIVLSLDQDNSELSNYTLYVKNYRAGKYAVYSSLESLWLFLIAIFPVLLIPSIEVILRIKRNPNMKTVIVTVVLIIVDLLVISLILMPFL